MRSPGTSRCRKGICISSECSSRCTSGSSKTTGSASRMARARLLVDRGPAEGRVPRAARVRRDAVEGGPVGGADQDDGGPPPARVLAQQAVAVRGHRPRVPEARVRAHEGDEAARRIDRARRVEVAIDLFDDRLRGAGIPAAGDRGRANRGDHGQAIHPPPHRGQGSCRGAGIQTGAGGAPIAPLHPRSPQVPAAQPPGPARRSWRPSCIHPPRWRRCDMTSGQGRRGIASASQFAPSPPPRSASRARGRDAASRRLAARPGDTRAAPRPAASRRRAGRSTGGGPHHRTASPVSSSERRRLCATGSGRRSGTAALDGGRRHADALPAHDATCGREFDAPSSRRAGSSSRVRRQHGRVDRLLDALGHDVDRPRPVWSNTTAQPLRLGARPPGTKQIALSIANEVSASPGSFAVHGDWNGDTNTWGAKQVLSFPAAAPALDTPRRSTWRSPCAATTPARLVSRQGQRRSSRASGTSHGLGHDGHRRRPTAPGTPCVAALAADPRRRPRPRHRRRGRDDGRVTTGHDGGTRTWGAVSPYHTTSAFGDLTRHRPFDLAWDPIVGSRNVLLVRGRLRAVDPPTRRTAG